MLNKNKVKQLYHKILDIKPREWEKIREHASQLMGNQKSEMWDKMDGLPGLDLAHLHFITQTHAARHAASMLEQTKGKFGKTIGKLIDHHNGSKDFENMDNNIKVGFHQVQQVPDAVLKFMKENPKQAKAIAQHLSQQEQEQKQPEEMKGGGFKKAVKKTAQFGLTAAAGAAAGALAFREYLKQNPKEAAKISVSGLKSIAEGALAFGGRKVAPSAVGSGLKGAGIQGAGVAGAGISGAGTGILSNIKPGELAKNLSNFTNHGVLKKTKQQFSHILSKFNPAENDLIGEISGQIAGKVPSKIHGPLVKGIKNLVDKRNYRNAAREFKNNIIHQKLMHKGQKFVTAVKHSVHTAASKVANMTGGELRYPTLHMISKGIKHNPNPKMKHNSMKLRTESDLPIEESGDGLISL